MATLICSLNLLYSNIYKYIRKYIFASNELTILFWLYTFFYILTFYLTTHLELKIFSANTCLKCNTSRWVWDEICESCFCNYSLCCKAQHCVPYIKWLCCEKSKTCIFSRAVWIEHYWLINIVISSYQSQNIFHPNVLPHLRVLNLFVIALQKCKQCKDNFYHV